MADHRVWLVLLTLAKLYLDLAELAGPVAAAQRGEGNDTSREYEVGGLKREGKGRGREGASLAELRVSAYQSINQSVIGTRRLAAKRSEDGINWESGSPEGHVDFCAFLFSYTTTFVFVVPAQPCLVVCQQP